MVEVAHRRLNLFRILISYILAHGLIYLENDRLRLFTINVFNSCTVLMSAQVQVKLERSDRVHDSIDNLP